MLTYRIFGSVYVHRPNWIGIKFHQSTFLKDGFTRPSPTDSGLEIILFLDWIETKAR